MTSDTASRAWASAEAPSLDDLELLGRDALAGLPTAFQRFAEQVQVRVADFAEDNDLDELGIDSEFDLLGLFKGIGRAHAAAVPETGQLPNMVWLYRRPILDYWASHEETLGAIVTNVLIHEIGHHFGLSDEDIDRIES